MYIFSSIFVGCNTFTNTFTNTFKTRVTLPGAATHERGARLLSSAAPRRGSPTASDGSNKAMMSRKRHAGCHDGRHDECIHIDL